MFLLANRNIVLPSKDGTEHHGVLRGFLGEVPDRFCDTAYFRALVADGKIVIPPSRKDKDVVATAEVAEKVLEDVVAQTQVDPDERPKRRINKKK